MIENLLSIRDHGVEKFLREQEKRWKCKSCGEVVCCHNGLCFNCDLEKLRSKKQKYRWDEKQKANSARAERTRNFKS
jgi:hypothetical protein